MVGIAGSAQGESKVLKNKERERIILECTQHVVVMILRAAFIVVSLFQAHLSLISIIPSQIVF